MAVYPIHKVIFYQSGNHAPAAVLSAADHATPEQLSSIRDAFEKAGWQQVPVYTDGQNALQVSGFKSRSDLEQWLRAQRFIDDETVISHPPHQDGSIQERIGKSSLKLTGLLNILGDGILALSGHYKKDPFRIAGGGLLSLGSMNLLRYGNVGSSHYVQEISDDLKTFISRQEGTPPPAVGTFTKAENFLYRNPAQVTLGINSLGATSNLISGIRHTRNGEGWEALGFGIGSVGLKLISLLIPEKAKSETGNPDTGGGLVGWIQEKPLRFYGYSSFVTDLFLVKSAFKEYKKNPKNWGLYTSTALAGTCYSLADLTVAMSNKDHTNQEDGKFTAYEQQEIEAIAAASILRHSPSERQRKADALGEFLAKRKEMHGNTQSISKAILDQASQLASSSWVERSAKITMSPIAGL